MRKGDFEDAIYSGVSRAICWQSGSTGYTALKQFLHSIRWNDAKNTLLCLIKLRTQWVKQQNGTLCYKSFFFFIRLLNLSTEAVVICCESPEIL